MLNKNQFVKYVSELVKLKRAQDKVEKAMRESILRDDFSGGLYGVNVYEDLMFKILRDSVDDKNDYFGYWLYELDCGSKYEDGCIKDGDGNNVRLKSAADLYNAIKKG